MNDTSEIIYCGRCGAEMKSSQRYCMKCGYLNYAHPDNESMRQYEQKNSQDPKLQPYIVGENNILGDGDTLIYADKAGKRKYCFLVNILIFIVFLFLGVFLLFLKNNRDMMTMIQDPTFSFLLILFPFFFLVSFAMQLVYMKANRPWWSLYIPFYNLYVFFEISMGKGWFLFLTLIPFVGLIFPLIGFYQLGIKFKKSGLFTLIFPWILIPVIAFSSTVSYQDIQYVEASTTLSNEEGQKVSVIENVYKQNKQLIAFILLVMLIGVGSLFYFNFDKFSEYFSNTKKEKFVNQVQEIMDASKKSVEEDSYECDDGQIITSLNQTFYIMFANPANFFPTKVKYSNFSGDEFSGYIKIVNQGSSSTYSIAVTDGQKGFREATSLQIRTDSIEDVSSITYPEGAVFCKKNK